MLNALVGLELGIDQIVAKTKASQNHPLENRLGIIEGLREVGSDNALAMAALVPGN
jgi:transcriptional regulator